MSSLKIYTFEKKLNKDTYATAYLYSNNVILAEAFYNIPYSSIYIYLNEYYFNNIESLITIPIKGEDSFGYVIGNCNTKIKNIVKSHITKSIKKKILHIIPYEQYKKYETIKKL